MIDTDFAATLRRSRALVVVAVIAGSALMALGAHVAVNVPFSPVPITGQTFTLALVVGLLGTRGAVLSLALYLAEGAAGLPVFAPTGTSMFGPTGGYLIAFPVAAFATGWLFDRGLIASFAGRTLAIAAGSLVVLAGGAAWLACFVGWKMALGFGIAPFLAGDALKTLFAAATVPWVRRYSIRSSIDTL